MTVEAQTLAKMPASTLIAGVDEVGRGALFGPVVAAAVVIAVADLGQLTAIAGKDSKQLSAKRREALASEIKAVVADVRIGYATVQEIDEMNILQATLQAMRRAVGKLTPQPGLCFVDGRQQIPELDIPQIALTQGDARSRTIAAASIMAKVWRDDLMVRLWDPQYPEYQLAANKGYGTSAHRYALQTYGPSPQHRLSFRPCRQSTP